MNKLVGLSGLKSLEHFRSYSGAGASKTFSSSPRPSDSVSLGSFANLKLTAGFSRNLVHYKCMYMKISMCICLCIANLR